MTMDNLIAFVLGVFVGMVILIMWMTIVCDIVDEEEKRD